MLGKVGGKNYLLSLIKWHCDFWIKASLSQHSHSDMDTICGLENITDLLILTVTFAKGAGIVHLP